MDHVLPVAKINNVLLLPELYETHLFLFICRNYVLSNYGDLLSLVFLSFII